MLYSEHEFRPIRTRAGFYLYYIYLFTYVFIIFLPLRNNFLLKEQKSQFQKMQWSKALAEVSNSYT